MAWDSRSRGSRARGSLRLAASALGVQLPLRPTTSAGGHLGACALLGSGSALGRLPRPQPPPRKPLCPQTSIKSLDGSVDEKKLRELTHRYLTLTARLERLGYNRDVHPVFSEFLINTYGILKQRPDLRANPLHSSPAALRKLVIDVVPPKFLGDSLLLLTCLCELSKEDHKPLFSW